MNVYLVGGAVRDALLNEPVHEQDWVVVGSTPEALLKLGYQQVGRDFPVFLHPETKAEYALARTERKAGVGYLGFVCDANPNVTLEEDLLRRDLTINAMARDEAGNLIDPYHGARDLKHKILRHVSPAFTEDPVRVLRLARFAARFKHLGFSVADETYDLMRQMVKNGELAHLVPERIWQEWQKSLNTQDPAVFLEVLHDVGALELLLRGLTSAQYMYMHEKLRSMTKHADDPIVRFAACMQGLDHEESIQSVCAHLRVPKAYQDLAKHALRFNVLIKHAKDAKTEVEALERVDAFRKPERFKALLTVCKMRTIEQSKWLAVLKACQAVNIDALVAQGHKGQAMKQALHDARVIAVQAIQ